MNITKLNEVLSDEIFKLRAGKVKPDRVNAIMRAASQIIGSARLQLAYMKLFGTTSATEGFFGKTIQKAIGNKVKN